MYTTSLSGMKLVHQARTLGLGTDWPHSRKDRFSQILKFLTAGRWFQTLISRRPVQELDHYAQNNENQCEVY